MIFGRNFGKLMARTDYTRQEYELPSRLTNTGKGIIG